MNEETRKAERVAETARKFAERQQLADKLNSLLRQVGELPVATPIHPLFALYSESYAAYLESPEWKKIRARVLKRDGKRCQHCSAKAQCVHHISYDEPVIIGERDEDLISLCNSCHEAIHDPSSRGGAAE